MKKEVDWLAADPVDHANIDDLDDKRFEASMMGRENPLGAPAFSEDGSGSAVVNNKFESLRDSLERVKDEKQFPSKTPRFGTNKTRQSRLSSANGSVHFSGPIINHVACKPEQE